MKDILIKIKIKWKRNAYDVEIFPPITETTAQQLMYSEDSVKKSDILQVFAATSLKLGN